MFDEDENAFDEALDDDAGTDVAKNRQPIADRRTYELALAAYAEFPGKHAQVAAIVSPLAKREISNTLMRLWWVRGLPSLGLPPISEALRAATRTALKMPEAPTEVTINPVSAKSRVRFRRTAAAAVAKSNETKALASVERERLALERDKVRVELARAEADKARADAEAAKAKASAAVAAGEISDDASSIVRMRSEQLKITGAIREQTLFTTKVFNRFLGATAKLIPVIEGAIDNEASTMNLDASTKLFRRAVTTLKDWAEFVERGVKLDQLVHGEATEISRVTVDSGDPIETIMQAMQAIQRSAERGAIEVTEDQRALMEAIEIEQPVEVDREVATDDEE